MAVSRPTTLVISKPRGSGDHTPQGDQTPEGDHTPQAALLLLRRNKTYVVSSERQ